MQCQPPATGLVSGAGVGGHTSMQHVQPNSCSRGHTCALCFRRGVSEDCFMAFLWRLGGGGQKEIFWSFRLGTYFPNRCRWRDPIIFYRDGKNPCRGLNLFRFMLYFIALSVFFIALSIFLLHVCRTTESGSRRGLALKRCCCVVLGYFPIVMIISSLLNLIDNTKLRFL